MEFNDRLIKVVNVSFVFPWVMNTREKPPIVNVFHRSLEQDPVALAEMIHRHLPVDVGSFGSEHGVLLWKKEQWLQEMQIRSVFVMHPSVFHELLNRNYLGRLSHHSFSIERISFFRICTYQIIDFG